MKPQYILAACLTILLFATRLVAEEATLPDFAKGIPQTTFVEKAKINGNDTFRLESPLSHKEFRASLGKFLGKNWSSRKLKREDMMIAAQRGRTMNATANLTAYVNAKSAGLEILFVHLKPKDAALPPIVEITVVQPALSGESPPSPQVLATLSSQQFYTQFALTRTMLEGTWDQKVFEKFSYYDGINLQMMKRYGEKLKDDKKWGPFFNAKNSLHMEVYQKLQPLIEKKRAGKKLTDADRKLLEDLDKRIFEKLIK